MPSAQAEKFDLTDYIQQIAQQKGKALAAPSALTSLDLAALGSKMTMPATPNVHRTTSEQGEIPMLGMGVDQITRNIITRTADADNVFKLFPDINLAAQIIVSSVLSPKDMIRSALNFRVEKSFLPTALVNEMMGIAKDEITTTYKLEGDLAKIMETALFKSGAYVLAVLPEAAVDELINSDQVLVRESAVDCGLLEKSSDGVLQPTHLGYLGNPSAYRKEDKQKQVFAFESILDQRQETYNPQLFVPKFTDKANAEGTLSELVDLSKFREAVQGAVSVIDNRHFLKMPALLDRFKAQREATLHQDEISQGATGFRKLVAEHAVASIQKQQALVGEAAHMSRKEIESLVYKGAKRQYRPFIKVPASEALKRRSVGRCLILALPTSAAVPVYSASDPSVHVGYFVPTDYDGNPVSEDSRGYENGGLGSAINVYDRMSNSGLSGYLTEKARKNLTDDEYVPIIESMEEILEELVECDLTERMGNGSIGRGFRIGRVQDAYRIMLKRILRGQQTRLVYVPAEYVSYFAFEYHKNGTGKSYLDDLRHITSLRATTLFGTVANLLKAAITVTKAEVEISENDPDPIRTAEKAKHFIARMRQSYFPHGLNRIVDLTDWVNKAGIELSFKGNSKLPKTSMNFETTSPSRPVPSEDLDERFRHQSYMHFGLSPETVDNAAKADFATTVENNSILFSKRITLLADIFSAKLTEHAARLVRFDQVILDRMLKAVQTHQASILEAMSEEEQAAAKENPASFSMYIVETFLSTLVVDLPRAESRRQENVGKAFADKEKEIDDALKYILDEEAIPEEFIGQAKEYIQIMSHAWKAHIMRRWMADNGYGEEAFEVLRQDEDGKPMTDLSQLMKANSTQVAKFIQKALEDHKALKTASNLDIDRATRGPGEQGPEGGEQGNAVGDTSPTPFDNPTLSGAGGDEEEGGTGGGETGGEPPAGGDQGGNPFDTL